jgi:hypothetical protein
MAFAPSRFRAQPSIGTLWPPDHSMVKVSILGVVDPNNNARMASHTMLMFLAVICAHVGGALSRKGRTDLMKYRGAAIAYTILAAFDAQRYSVVAASLETRLLTATALSFGQESGARCNHVSA